MIAYVNSADDDVTSQRIRVCCKRWRRVDMLSDEALGRCIRSDGIDILIDLAGHTARNRLAVFAWKPAPIQVSWLGYFATTGVATLTPSTLIADPRSLPLDQEAFFVERIWSLPETRLCFTPPDVEVVPSCLPAATEGRITFGCFNNLCKINDSVIEVWSAGH